MSPVILASLAAAILFVVGIASVVFGGGRNEELASRSAATDADRFSGSFYDALGQRFARTRLGRAVADRVEQGNLRGSPVDYVMVAVGVALVVTFVLSRLVPVLIAAAFGGLTLWLGWRYLERRVARRTQRFIDQLADIARILSGAAFAGLSVAAGVNIAARELEEPAATEMALVAERLAIGGTLDSAMTELRGRVPSREVGVLIGTLLIQQRAGGDTVRSLGDIAEVLEARADTLREVNNILARGKSTARILPCVGIAMLLIGDAIRSGSLRDAFSNPIGLGLMAVAFVLWAIGLWAIGRVTRLPDWYEDGSADAKATPA